jgi:hypothetical protein
LHRHARVQFTSRAERHLEHKSSTLGLLVTTKFKVLATLESKLHLVLAGSAFETQDNLLGGLSLLVEDGLGLTTITGLLTAGQILPQY